MPTKPRVEPDLAMHRACQLLLSIQHWIPQQGRSAAMVEMMWRNANEANHTGYTAAEYRAAVKALRECGALQYSRGIYTRGQMF